MHLVLERDFGYKDRAGLVCAGYPPQRGTWPKRESKLSIQIKSSPRTRIVCCQRHTTATTGRVAGPEMKSESLPSYRGQPPRIGPSQERPVLTADDRLTVSTLPTASVMYPNEKLSALSSKFPSTPANIFPMPSFTAPVPFPERRPKEYQPVRPLHKLTRTEHDLTPQSTTPHIDIMHATRTNSPIKTSQSGASSQATAQSPTSQFPSLIVPPASMPGSGAPGCSISNNTGRREKDEMIAGRPFYPFDKELVLERERCSAACWRFNNSTSPFDEARRPSPPSPSLRPAMGSPWPKLS